MEIQKINGSGVGGQSAWRLRSACTAERKRDIDGGNADAAGNRAAFSAADAGRARCVVCGYRGDARFVYGAAPDAGRQSAAECVGECHTAGDAV